MTHAATAPPPTLRLKDRAFFRISRMGGARQLLFTPFVVAKFARGRRNRTLLGREIRNLAAAKLSGFWKDVIPTSFSLGSLAMVSARYANVGVRDHGAASAFVERRLARSLDGGRTTSAKELVTGNAVLATLDADARARARAALAPLDLPATGSHGDFHMYNFCKTGAGDFVLVDWEHFDAAGSFILDYVEFHTANRCFSQLPNWLAFLEDRPGPDASAVHAASRLGCDAQALWLLYLLVKLDTLAQRRGGFAAMPAGDAGRFAGLARRQVDAAFAAAA